MNLMKNKVSKIINNILQTHITLIHNLVVMVNEKQQKMIYILSLATIKRNHYLLVIKKLNKEIFKIQII